MRIPSIIVLLLILIISSCDIKNNDFEPSSTFTKIYDDSRFEEEYYPLSIVQTSDGGYLILSELKNEQSLFTSVHVLKIDEAGDVVQSTIMTDPNGLPIGSWNEIDGTYYFICMNTSSLAAQLVAVDADGTVADPVQINGVTYPLVSEKDGNNIMLLSFDNLNSETVFSVVNTSGGLTQQAGYTIGAGVDVEKPIIDHLTRNGPKIPFNIGKSGGEYFFNGFYNYTFSMVFTNFGADPTGVCQGQLSLGGISKAINLGGNEYAVARYNFGANYLNPTTQIPSNQITSSVDLGGNTFPEIETGSIVNIRQEPESQQLVYGTHTNSRRLVLYGYDSSDGSIRGTEYIGSGNPYLFSDFTFTTDGGIVVLSQIGLEGRFPRIAVFKRDKAFLGQLIQ